LIPPKEKKGLYGPYFRGGAGMIEISRVLVSSWEMESAHLKTIAGKIGKKGLIVL
jgi:hypothetical protein